METCCEYTDKTLYISSDHQKWINRIRKLKSEYPGDVEIKNRPEDNDGCICATLPAAWLKISPPRKVEMTDEQRQAASERMKALAENQKQKRFNSEHVE